VTSNQPDDSKDKGKPMRDAATATSLQRQPQHSWHSLDFPAIYASLGASDRGLSEHEASVRLRQYGPNTLPEQGVAPLWLIVLRQSVNPLIYILVIAAVVSVLIGEAKDAAFIAAVLAINAVIGTYQEWRAEKSMHALKKLLRIHALRPGKLHDDRHRQDRDPDLQ